MRLLDFGKTFEHLSDALNPNFFLTQVEDIHIPRLMDVSADWLL
jgi:hypothetical protein